MRLNTIDGRRESYDFVVVFLTVGHVIFLTVVVRLGGHIFLGYCYFYLIGGKQKLNKKTVVWPN